MARLLKQTETISARVQACFSLLFNPEALRNRPWKSLSLPMSSDSFSTGWSLEKVSAEILLSQPSLLLELSKFVHQYDLTGDECMLSVPYSLCVGLAPDVVLAAETILLKVQNMDTLLFIVVDLDRMFPEEEEVWSREVIKMLALFVDLTSTRSISGIVRIKPAFFTASHIPRLRARTVLAMLQVSSQNQ